LEINSSPGLEGIERASGVDVATAIVEHAERFVTRYKSVRRRGADDRYPDSIDHERTITLRRVRSSGSR
jgi:ribosomal protein S6--L-glutamate ligase